MTAFDTHQDYDEEKATEAFRKVYSEAKDLKIDGIEEAVSNMHALQSGLVADNAQDRHLNKTLEGLMQLGRIQRQQFAVNIEDYIGDEEVSKGFFGTDELVEETRQSNQNDQTIMDLGGYLFENAVNPAMEHYFEKKKDTEYGIDAVSQHVQKGSIDEDMDKMEDIMYAVTTFGRSSGRTSTHF